MPFAVLCRELGSLGLEDVPPQPLGNSAVRVEIRAAGINFPDILMCAGLYQHKPPLPFTPGMEAAGVVTEIGRAVTDVAVGDKVIIHHRTGLYAAEAVVPPDSLLPLPKGFSFEEGASFLVANLTAYHALTERGALQRGETLLVHGAGGGVGLAAVELGKLLGARVIACASSDDKLAVALARGADHLINTRREAFAPRVKALTGEEGADVIYDPVGGESFTQSFRCIAWGGRLLVIGFAGGTIPAVEANRILIKGCAVIGVRAGEAGRRDPARGAATLAAIQVMAAEGKLRPHISHRLPLAAFAEGMALLSERKAIGRVVLVP
ncbi:MAG TPA: NADPH:quinone oxidoreductase family protein [Stellaceae bacterium]|nr:NADPH:quinone oxidoreductase family protein [Stellaceae bacterium]